jgi:dihydroflavonol-4-reductase
MRIAITGANGHVGCNLTRLLLEEGHELRLLIHQREDAVAGLAAERVRGDITDPTAIASLVRGMDALIHAAGRISIDGDRDGSLARVNAAGTRTVVDACLAERVGRLVHFSTIHTYDPAPTDQPLDETRGPVLHHVSDYDRSKLMADEAVRDGVARGLDAVIVAPTSVIGPNDHYPSLLGQAVIDLGRGRMPVLVPGGYDFVDVRDLCRGVVAALTRGRSGEKYLLSGHYLTIRELAALIGEASGRKAPTTVLPGWLLRGMVPVFRGVAWASGRPPLLTRESLLALTEGNPSISSAKAERELSYIRRPVAETVADTVAWFRQAGRLN